VEILRSIQQLDAIRDEWNALADARGDALLRHEWIVSAARTLHRTRPLAIACVKRSGELVAAAPLVEPPGYSVAPLQFIGAAVLHEPGGLLARDAAARAALLDALARMQRPLALDRVQIDADELCELRTLGERRGFLVVKRTAPVLSVPVAAQAIGPVARPSRRLGYDLRRAWARASEHGRVTTDVLAPGPSDVDEAFETFVNIEACGWKGRAGSALAMRPQLRAFFATYARLAAASGILRIFLLRLGSRIGAAQVAVEAYGRLWVLKIAYDEGVARCSPGFLLTAEAIRYAASRGLSAYEFLGSAEAWERRWPAVERPTTLVAWYPPTVRGCIGASLHLAGSTWRRARELRRAS
jgi:CelD/BcsL family acetyltransferase involved in cellulose biosynthesis